MPRKRLEPHLRLKPGRVRKNGTTEKAVYLICDPDLPNPKQTGTDLLSVAKEKLAEYTEDKALQADQKRQRAPSEVSISEILVWYSERKLQPKTKGEQPVSRPKEFNARIDSLDVFWGHRPVSDIDEDTCAEYVDKRGAVSSARRELEDLRSAVNSFYNRGKISQLPKVILPKKSETRKATFTRKQVAALLWTAWRKRKSYTHTRRSKTTGKEGETKLTKHYTSRHLCHYILTALYTGTRKERIWRASYKREAGRPWIDLENGVYYRLALGEKAPDNKQAPEISIPPKLLGHMRRWHKNGDKYLVQYGGRAANPSRALRNLIREVLGEHQQIEGLDEGFELSADIKNQLKFVAHTFRHTSATWLAHQPDVSLVEVGGYVGVTPETLQRVYVKTDKGNQSRVINAIQSGQIGRTVDKKAST